MHNLSKTIALMGLLTPMGVSALGIGDIRLHSALNQSLSAEVPLVLSGGESLDDIKVSLASPEAFTKAGVERHYFLTRLQFSAARASNGNYVIRISSRDVMREPFLNFLVEVNWPQGRMLREFTVLLDPPSTLPEETVAETTAPAVERIAEIRRSDDVHSVRRPVSRPAAPATRRPASPPPPEDQLTNATYGPVRRDENLWGIAKTIERDPSVTHEQMVVALYRANPQAFRGNINSLKAGATLRIPQHKFIVQLSPQQARNEFAHEQGLNVGRLAGRGTEEPLAAAEQESPQSQLKLLAPTETKSKGQNAVSGNQAGGKGKDGADLKRELDDTVKQENEEFRSRMTQLEQRLADMQRMLTLKDEYIASLQAQQQANSQKPPVTPPKPATQTQTAPLAAQQPPPKREPSAVNPAAAQQPTVKPEPAATQQTVAKPESAVPLQSAAKPGPAAAQQPAIKTEQSSAAQQPAAKPEQPSAVQQQSVAKPESSSAQQPAAKQDPLAGKLPVAPQPAPGEPAVAQQPVSKPESPEVKPQPPQSVPGAAAQESGQTSTQPAIAKPTGTAAPTAQPQPQAPSQQVSKPAPAKPVRPKPVTPPPAAEDSGFPIEPTYLIAGGGSVALLGLAAWLIARRRRAMIAATESILLAAERESRQKLQVVNPSMTMESLPEPMGAVKSSFLSEFTPSDFDALGTETDEVDPISEADVYLAYGRHKQAEELIRHAILQHPERDEFKLKLLEIYFSTENRSSFERYTRELKAANKDAQKGFWAKVEEMGRELLPNNTLFQSPARRQKASGQSFDSSKALASLDLSDDLIDDLRRFDLEFVESSASDGEFELIGLSTTSGKEEHIPLASDAGIPAKAPASAENTEEVDSYASLDFKSAPLNLDQADDESEATASAQSQSEDSGEAENLITFDLGKMAVQPQTGAASPEQPDLIDSNTADGGEEDEYLMLGSDTEHAKEADSHALEFDLVSLSLDKAETTETQPQEQEDSEDVGNLIAFDLGKTAVQPQADAAIQERPDKTIDDILLELAGLEHEQEESDAESDVILAMSDRAPDTAGLELNLLESDNGVLEEEGQESMPVVAFEGGEDLFADLADDSDADQFDTKLDLAKAYADMEDEDSARDILQEVAAMGNERQKAEANRLLESMDQSNLRPRLSLVEPRSGRM